MGQMFLYDALLSKRLKEEFTLFGEDDIDLVMNRICKLIVKKSLPCLFISHSIVYI